MTNQMYNTMYNINGVALEDNQMGLDLNIPFMAVPPEIECDTSKSYFFETTEIIQSIAKYTMKEGSLSAPDIRA